VEPIYEQLRAMLNIRSINQT